MKFIDQKLLLRLGGLLGAGSATMLGTTVMGHGIYAGWSVNSSRQSNFTEKFHLTPESLRIPYKSVTFATEDGVNLNGWLLEPTVHGRHSQKTIILMHPYNAHKSNLLHMAEGMWDHSYNVFLFDFRSFATPRTRQSLGWLEQRDALAAITWCMKNVPCEEGIVLMGASMGASVTCCVAPKVQDVARLKAIVLDCPFCTLEDVVRFNTFQYGKLPAFLVNPSVWVAKTFNKLWYGYNYEEVSPEESIKFLDPEVDLMIIHSENDIVCPMEHGRRIYVNSPAKRKKWWTSEQTEHCGAFFKDPKTYIKSVTRFLDDSFDKREEPQPGEEEGEGLLQQIYHMGVSKDEPVEEETKQTEDGMVFMGGLLTSTVYGNI